MASSGGTSAFTGNVILGQVGVYHTAGPRIRRAISSADLKCRCIEDYAVLLTQNRGSGACTMPDVT